MSPTPQASAKAASNSYDELAQKGSTGFTLDFTDLREGRCGRKECSCRSEESSVWSSSVVRLNKPTSRASVVPKWLVSWGSGQ